MTPDEYRQKHKRCATCVYYGKPVAAEIQDKPAPAETLTCRSCKECRGYKFCASRSRDYPCSCFIKNER